MTNLIGCRDCGNTVSVTARVCPHCGAPKPGYPYPPRNRYLIIVILLGLIVALSLGLNLVLLAPDLVAVKEKIGVFDRNTVDTGTGAFDRYTVDGETGAFDRYTVDGETGTFDRNTVDTGTGTYDRNTLDAEIDTSGWDKVDAEICNGLICDEYIVTVESANVRKEARMESPIIHIAVKGDRAVVLQQKDEWMFMYFYNNGSKEGWIHSRLIEHVKAID